MQVHGRGFRHHAARVSRKFVGCFAAARGKAAPAAPVSAAAQEQAMEEYTVIPLVERPDGARGAQRGAVPASVNHAQVTAGEQPPSGGPDARWASFGNESTRLKEELHKTMDRLTKLKQDMRPGQTKPPGVALDMSKVQRDPEGSSGPLSPSQHGTADFVDTGESRLSQMSNIEERLMGMDSSNGKFSEQRPKMLPPVNSQPARSSHSGNVAPPQNVPTPNVLHAAASISVAPTKERQRPTLVPAERLDKETMNKWYEIFSHRTRPQHPGTDSVLLCQPPALIDQ